MSLLNVTASLVAFTVFFGSVMAQTRTAYAQQDLVPLEMVLAEEVSFVTLAYSMERCTGLFSAFSVRAANRADRQDSQQVSGEFEQLGMEFLQFAINFRQRYTGRGQDSFYVSLGEATEQMSIQQRVYNNLMDAEYARSGNALSDFLVSDMGMCMRTYEVLTEQ